VAGPGTARAPDRIGRGLSYRVAPKGFEPSLPP
jgi:hypothetical protein